MGTERGKQGGWWGISTGNEVAVKSSLRLGLCAAFLFGGFSARAQSAGITRGAQIRFQVSGDSLFRSGFLSRFTQDSLIVERCPTCYGRLTYSRAELTRLDVSKRRPGGLRALTGFAIGATTGLALGFLSAVNCKGGDKCDGAILLLPFGGLLGGLIGASAGYLSSYKWEPVSLAR